MTRKAGKTGRAQSARPSGKTKSAPRHKKTLPYLELIRDRDGIKVWIVDGSYIRTHIDEEFTNFGEHYAYPYIPKKEFWIDQGVGPKEQEFFIAHMKREYRMMERGVPQDEALQAGDAAEERERKKAGDVTRLTQGGVLPDPAKVHSKLWKRLENGVQVWIVNARLVRSVFDDDFASGGHFHVYEYIPENEVWIDDTLKPAERPYALLHELHERNLMEKGWDYDRAHADSSKLEHHVRLHPTELHDALSAEGWE